MHRRGYIARRTVVLAEELPVLGADVVEELEAGVLEAVPLCRSCPYLDADGCGILWMILESKFHGPRFDFMRSDLFS